MDNPNHLLILWTSGERETALNMVFMYGLNARLKNWWDNVTLLIWGASSRLMTEDEELQGKLPAMKEAGVRVIACRKCAENLHVVEKMEALGLEVFYTGEFITEWLKSGKKMITV